MTPNGEAIHIDKMWKKYWQLVEATNEAWRVALNSWPRDTKKAVHLQSLRAAYQRRAASAQRRQIMSTTP